MQQRLIYLAKLTVAIALGISMTLLIIGCFITMVSLGLLRSLSSIMYATGTATTISFFVVIIIAAAISAIFMTAIFFGDDRK